MQRKTAIALMVLWVQIISCASDNRNCFQDNINKLNQAIKNNNDKRALGHYQNMQTLDKDRTSQLTCSNSKYAALLKRTKKKTTLIQHHKQNPHQLTKNKRANLSPRSPRLSQEKNIKTETPKVDSNAQEKKVYPIQCIFIDKVEARRLTTIWQPQDALVVAARHNLIDVVEKCIKEKVDINAGMTTSKNATALSQSVVNCNVKIAELLLNHGAKIQKRLIGSCWLQHFNDLEKDGLENELESRGKILYLLVKAGASLEEKNYDEATPLITACQYYGPEQALMLIEKGAQINAQDKCGLTPLYFACIRGNVALVKELIAKGADISNSEDVLANACENKNAEVAIYLINEQKIKPSERHLRLAVEHENIKLAKFLLKKECTYTTKNLSTDLYEALKNKKQKSVEFLIKQGASIDQAGEYGYTPLTRACSYLDVDMLKLCISHNANLNQRDIQGRLPLTEALTNRPNELQNPKKIAKIVHSLLESGADPNQECSEKKRRPLDLAISNAPELVKILLEHGADPNYACAGTNVCSDDESCLKYAVRLTAIDKPQDYVTRALVPLIDNVTNKEHITQALRSLLKQTYYSKLNKQEFCEVIKALTLAKANLHVTDKDGNTPLLKLLQSKYKQDLASEEILELIKVFVEHGADINHKNNEGKSALNVALSNCKHYSWRSTQENNAKSEKSYPAIQHLIKLGARVDGQIGDHYTSFEGGGYTKKINKLLEETFYKQNPDTAARQQANTANQSDKDNNNDDQG